MISLVAVPVAASIPTLRVPQLIGDIAGHGVFHLPLQSSRPGLPLFGRREKERQYNHGWFSECRVSVVAGRSRYSMGRTGQLSQVCTGLGNSK